MSRRIAIYARYSTVDDQTTENQIGVVRGGRTSWLGRGCGVRRPGRQWQPPARARPAMKALLPAVMRREVDMGRHGRWDRLGRSPVDLLGFLGELHAKQVDLCLHQQGLDASTRAGRAMFQMLGLFAEFLARLVLLLGVRSARAAWRQCQGEATG